MLRSCPGISRSLGRTVASCRSLHTSAGAWNYKSNVNLHNIYPQSDLDITKPQEIPKTEGNNFSGYIPMDKVQLTYSRSSGPGGQNVNRINTKVDLRFHLASAEWLSPELKEKLATKHKTSITSNGFLVIRSDKTRSQQLNVAEAMDKLRHLIYTAAFVPPPPAAEDIERARRRHEASTRERLRQKKSHSITKQGRRAPELS
ncbi:peptidyl-tRNA hydrolase ICT1, mitochondrial-like [Portunus trituberculatus]|uniref:peptidyl-tRNA hydrolase ICT1, mitochondrial-like n=1 Tax=Portunus trituberculatus TaxID=210409 RepID=UPI001E1D1E14|nr:peptidyl-tRNA hydrolase ICT1, mitochondrial-like [Portunus trituberculatus]